MLGGSGNNLRGPESGVKEIFKVCPRAVGDYAVGSIVDVDVTVGVEACDGRRVL